VRHPARYPALWYEEPEVERLDPELERLLEPEEVRWPPARLALAISDRVIRLSSGFFIVLVGLENALINIFRYRGEFKKAVMIGTKGTGPHRQKQG
jgi:hypothetical protein